MPDKKHLLIISAICCLGAAISLTKFFAGGLSIAVIGFFIFAMIPYFTLFTLSSWFRPYWINYITGILILGFDLYFHLEVFVFAQDSGTAALLFISGPIYLAIQAVIMNIVLEAIYLLIKFVKKEPLFPDDYRAFFTTKNILFLFVIPLVATLIIANAGFFLMDIG